MEHFNDATHLLAFANQYLDELRRPASVEEAFHRAREVAFLLSEMRRFNFHAPKFGIRELFREMRFAEKEELLEAMPFLKRMMYSLNVRKWTYERTKISYLSIRLAYFSLKHQGLLDFLPHLPYDGGYLRFVEKGGGAAYLVFRDLEKLLKGERRLEAVFSGTTFTDLKKRWRKGLLPTTTATVLASTAVSFSTEEALRKVEEKEKEEMENLEDLNRYESIVSKYDVKRLEEDPEYLWRLLQELEESGFLDKEGNVREDIINGLKKRRALRYRIFLSFSQGSLSRFLTEYYLYFPKGVREATPPLRGIPPLPGELLKLLVSFKVSDCTSAEPRQFVERLLEVEGVLPLKRKRVADHVLHSICPALGREDEAVEDVLNSLGRSERAKRFMELLRRGGGDKD